MFMRMLKGGALAAVAGAAMLAMSASSASAFTLSSPSIERPIVSSNIDHVYCYNCGWGHGYRWGYHPYYRPYYRPYMYARPYWVPRPRCGYNNWGRWVCW